DPLQQRSQLRAGRLGGDTDHVIHARVGGEPGRHPGAQIPADAGDGDDLPGTRAGRWGQVPSAHGAPRGLLTAVIRGDGPAAVGPGAGYLPSRRRWTRVLRSSLRCFFLAMRLRRFLTTEPIVSNLSPTPDTGTARAVAVKGNG